MRDLNISKWETNSVYEHDSRVYTFVPEDDHKMIQKLKEIDFPTTDRLYKNYSSIDWYSFEAITVLLQDDKIVSFSSVWNREFYEFDEVRILNRYWKSMPSRRFLRVIAGVHNIESARQQMEISKKLGFKKCFISRERNKKYLSTFVEKIASSTGTEWNISPEKVSVCNPKEPSCWQYKAWTLL